MELDVDELENLADRLARVQPLVGRVAVDRTVRGFSGVLVDALTAEETASWSVDLDPVLRRGREAIDAALDGRVRPVSWRELIDGEAS